MLHRSTPLLITSALLALAGCAPERPSDWSEGAATQGVAIASDPVVVRVGDEALTRRQIDARIEGLAPFAQRPYAATSARKELLQMTVLFEALADRAEADGLGQDIEALSAMREQLVRELLDARIDARVPDDLPDDARLQALYEDYLDMFSTPELRRPLLLLFRTEEQALQARGELLDIPALDDRLRRAGGMAAASTIDSLIASRSGDLGLLRAPVGEDATDRGAAQVFSLAQVGDVSEPVEIDGDWGLYVLAQSQPATRQAIEQVEPQIVQMARDQDRARARESILEELRQKSEVQLREQTLARIQPPGP